MAFDKYADNELSPVADPSAASPTNVPGASTPSFGWVTVWRIMFLASALVIGMVVVQVLWVTSFGGLGGLRGWMIQMTNSVPDSGDEWGWVKMSGLIAMLVAVLVFSWRKQSPFLRATRSVNRR